MGVQCHETVLEYISFINQGSKQVESLESIANWKSATKKNNRIYDCYCENSPALEPETGRIDNMIATTDLGGALIWLSECITETHKNHFYFLQKDDIKNLFEALVLGRRYKTTAYKNGDENHEEHFTIFVNSSYLS